MISKTTRRGFVAASAALAPAIALGGPVPTVSAVDSAKWEEALATLATREMIFNQAIDAREDVTAAYKAWLRANPEPMGIAFVFDGKPVPPDQRGAFSQARRDAWAAANTETQQRLGVDDALEVEHTAGDEFQAALNDLLACPAPDLKAVARKMELALEYDAPLDGVIAELRHFHELTAKGGGNG